MEAAAHCNTSPASTMEMPSLLLVKQKPHMISLRAGDALVGLAGMVFHTQGKGAVGTLRAPAPRELPSASAARGASRGSPPLPSALLLLLLSAPSPPSVPGSPCHPCAVPKHRRSLPGTPKLRRAARGVCTPAAPSRPSGCTRGLVNKLLSPFMLLT